MKRFCIQHSQIDLELGGILMGNVVIWLLFHEHKSKGMDVDMDMDMVRRR